MCAVLIRVPTQANQTEFNLRRWSELLINPALARLDYRIETDRFGRMIMSPPPSRQHGARQLFIGQTLAKLLPTGEALTECPVSTDDGVKAVDVAWLSAELSARTRGEQCLRVAPTLCVEVQSPSNSDAELEEKAALYFQAGAEEVWICRVNGAMDFMIGSPFNRADHSRRCPSFPNCIDIQTSPD